MRLHYLIAVATNCKNMMTTSTIDIGKYENYMLSGSKVIDFLLKNEGGNSLILKSSDILTFMIPDKDTDPNLYVATCDILLERVSDWPALVSAFNVFNEFRDQEQVFFSSSLYEVGSDEELTGMHSMVLIGGRKSSVGEYFFLLQNWWEGKYFIEVSAEYMHRCNAIITFVKKTITRKQEISDYVCDALYSETSADAAETIFERAIV